MPEQTTDYTHEKVAGIDVVTFFAYDDAWVPDRHTRITHSLCSLIDGGAERLILDFSNIRLFDSDYIEMLIRVAKKLCGTSWHPFTICPDRETALNLVPNAESAPLIFCAVSPEVREVFRVLRLYEDQN